MGFCLEHSPYALKLQARLDGIGSEIERAKAGDVDVQGEVCQAILGELWDAPATIAKLGVRRIFVGATPPLGVAILPFCAALELQGHVQAMASKTGRGTASLRIREEDEPLTTVLQPSYNPATAQPRWAERATKTAVTRVQGLLAGKHNSQPPYGYTLLGDGRLKPDPLRAGVVKEVFDYYLKHKSTTKVAKWLIRRGADKGTRSGTPWSGPRIASMLSCRTYLGMVLYGNFCVTGAHQPLVGQGLFDQAQEQLKQNAKRARCKVTVPPLEIAPAGAEEAAIMEWSLVEKKTVQEYVKINGAAPLAKALGCSRSTIYNWTATGGRPPNKKRQQELAVFVSDEEGPANPVYNTEPSPTLHDTDTVSNKVTLTAPDGSQVTGSIEDIIELGNRVVSKLIHAAMRGALKELDESLDHDG